MSRRSAAWTSMSRRGAVLAGLRAAGETGVSGETLALDLGVSRMAIAKHVAALRAAGYEIAASPGAGYRLVAAPDLPLPFEVAPLLETDRFGTLLGGGPTGSTNDDAKALARDGAAEGTVVLASRQRAGRGRLGRSWVSPEGGVYLSVVLRPAISPSEASALALVVGLGAAEGLERLGVHALVKWPNDLTLAKGKVAGVLLEMSAETDRVDWVVAGIGLNVRRGAEAIGPAAYLDDEHPPVRLAPVAAAVLDGIATALADFERGGFAGLRGRYAARDALFEREVVVRDATGARIAAGMASGVDERGRLVLIDAAGEKIAVAAGEVTLRAADGVA